MNLNDELDRIKSELDITKSILRIRCQDIVNLIDQLTTQKHICKQLSDAIHFASISGYVKKHHQELASEFQKTIKESSKQDLYQPMTYES